MVCIDKWSAVTLSIWNRISISLNFFVNITVSNVNKNTNTDTDAPIFYQRGYVLFACFTTAYRKHIETIKKDSIYSTVTISYYDHYAVQHLLVRVGVQN